MKEKKLHPVRVADHINEIGFGENGLAVVYADNKKICLARQEDKLFACALKCPHAGGYLADGQLDAAGNIICPNHRFHFNLQNGYNTSGEGYHLKVWRVEAGEEGVFVIMEEGGGLFGIFH
jgi:nitrite reductase/ring-hydroxylating ferredoxin subunit